MLPMKNGVQPFENLPITTLELLFGIYAHFEKAGDQYFGLNEMQPRSWTN